MVAKKAVKKKKTASKAAKAPTGLLAHFTGPKNRDTCIAELLNQELIVGDRAIATAIYEKSKVVGFDKDEILITEGAHDTDVYFLIAGSVRIIVKGDHKRDRSAGITVGEMAAIVPTQTRSATVTANEEVVALKMTSADLLKQGEKTPQIWKLIARSLSRRLFERNSEFLEPNAKPRLFIISSVESLPVADGFEIGLQYDVRPVVWRQGIFLASEYTLQSLEDAADATDFAIAIAHPDDIIEHRGKQYWTVRDNVIYELGLFTGIIGRKRTMLLIPRGIEVKLPSDLQGLTCIRYRMPEKDETIEQAIGPACSEIRGRIKALNARVRPKRKL